MRTIIEKNLREIANELKGIRKELHTIASSTKSGSESIPDGELIEKAVSSAVSNVLYGEKVKKGVE